MRTAELGVIYILVGMGVTVAALLRARTQGWMNAGLLLFFWPLYGPFILMNPVLQGSEFSGAFMVEGVSQRLEELSARAQQIKELLSKPDFQLEAAKTLSSEHEARGETKAAARVHARIESILRLKRHQTALADQLAEARELMAQLRVQSEVIRVAGGSDADTAALVQELECRVEGLDALLQDPCGSEPA